MVKDLIKDLMPVALFALSWVLAACTQHEVKVSAPQLDQVIKKIVVQDCKPTKYAMKPIPQDVEIDIKGDKVKANDGGIELLREYVAARKILK